MSMRNYGIYQQGAIFYPEDFDPCKVILLIGGKCRGVNIPVKIKNALEYEPFNIEAASKVCTVLGMDIPPNINEMKDFKFIADFLMDEAEYSDWFNSDAPLMGTEGADACYFSEIEGEYVYESPEKENERVEDCFMFSLNFPKIWEVGDYVSEKKNCRTKDEVLRFIHKIAEPLLKDNIDWEKRLGFLIGSGCC